MTSFAFILGVAPLAVATGAVVVLKGSGSVVAAPTLVRKRARSTR